MVGDKIVSCYTKKKYEVVEVGLMHPEEEPTHGLQVGQVGYLGRCISLVLDVVTQVVI
jgi:translation elongation factor EF-4